MVEFRIPTATYRVQMTPDFGFADARAVTAYLARLGVTDLYCSPILTARPGSLHGYDVTNPHQLNPELGTRADFDDLVAELKYHGMGLLLDIVPNHMAASSDNEWWIDVLENGPDSAYADYFDIEWHPIVANGGPVNRVLLPILGSPYGETLENGEIRIQREGATFVARYYEAELPINISSYADILGYRFEELEARLGTDHAGLAAYRALLHDFHELPPPTKENAAAIQERRQFRQAILDRFDELLQTSDIIRRHLDESLEQINGSPGSPGSFNVLDHILSKQAYRLAFWQLARERINYRRFFDINDLVSLQVQLPEVFDDTHRLILELARAGQVTGLRIDHVDGLFDPKGYLAQLRTAITGADDRPAGCHDFYVVVEKILTGDEELPAGWATCGTTGYDFLNVLGGLYVDGSQADQLDRIYREVSGFDTDVADLAYRKKKLIMEQLFEATVSSLSTWLDRVAETDRHGRDITYDSLRQAMVETTACLPVYRTYIRGRVVADRDRIWIEQAIADACERAPDHAHALAFLRRLLLLNFPNYLSDDDRWTWESFVYRWQQFTGPVMAKGFEDTALYVYNRLLSQNEVGGHPERSHGTTVEQFHSYNRYLHEQWPHTLNTTSTHDTKRGEDVRARINVLSEIPEQWEDRLARWRELNGIHLRSLGSEPVPNGNVELMIYQSLVGAWPLAPDDHATFRDRFKQYLIKASREAKTHTSWANPNQQYEDRLLAFTDSILDQTVSSDFLDDLAVFQSRVARWGAINGLSQTLLKLTSPGVPDIYQGSELWNLSLVDPDNRRPVDYELRVRLLSTIEQLGDDPDPAMMLDNWKTGLPKLFLVRTALQARQRFQGAFNLGLYLPIATTGRFSDNVVAFARQTGEESVIVVAPRLVTRVYDAGEGTFGTAAWADTRLGIPAGAPDRWRNLLTGDQLEREEETFGGGLLLDRFMARFPAALLVPEP